MRKHLPPRFGHQRLCDISRVEIQQYILEKLKQGFAWETSNHLRNLMSKVLGTAVSWNYLADNVVRGVKMPERSLKRPHQFLNVAEVKRLISACNEPTRTIVLLATMTGLRIGEILALRWKRIDFIGETLIVAETCFMGHFGTPKTRARRREVPLSRAVVEALKAHYLGSANRSPEGFVFATRHGGPWVSNNLRRRGLQSACNRAGLPRLN
jgi:integrase